MLKIEPSEITPFFYNNFFDFGGGERSLCPPPGGAYDMLKTIECIDSDEFIRLSLDDLKFKRRICEKYLKEIQLQLKGV